MPPVRPSSAAAVLVAGLLLAGPAVSPASAATEKVRRGDTLWALSARTGVPVRELATFNRLRDPDRVRAGSVLRIPPGRRPRAAGLGRAGARLPAALRDRPERLALRPRFQHWARTYGVPPDLLQALAWWESGWQNQVVSDQGAVGIGQLTPATVRFVNNVLLRASLDPTRPDDNIRLSARFLRYLLDQTGGRVDQAVASYYQGLASVRSRGVMEETRRYTAGVLALRSRF